MSDSSSRRKPSLSPLGPQQAEKKKRGFQLSGSSARDARGRSTSTTNMAMLCIPSANLELLSTLQQDMHSSLRSELELESWSSVNEAVQKSTVSNTVVIVGVGTRWSRPCRVLFTTLQQAVLKYRELTVGVAVQLLLVDHETSTDIDLERVPIGVPATFVFVRGVPILFSRPASSSSETGAASTPQTAAGNAFDEEENNDNNPGDEERDDVDETPAPAAPTSPQTSTRKCMCGTLSIAQAEFLVEHSVSAASRVIKMAPSFSQSVSSPIVDLYEELDSPFAQELRMRRR